ncbi:MULTISPECIES: helix-turn-helix transcriptional regulator [unclassified Sporosarcina]|uniref:helix-turn-helix transcriptional regulator n=1 Tax=unclassified Sporosarcina TaxID=2647733 RepID=UPI000C167DB5|nr:MULTISPECIES: helix-turn-helix domain-containing protein [unclassified Sporosarcina]PIC70556.1 transcriptional regulator [Sporosarcina sp. P16b]PID26190.1 transcriptional regulator [Sporosarcina sp. P7]
MNQQQLIELISLKLRVIRLEKEYSQQKMADVLGLSKKTLIQIEKARAMASWTAVIAVCALFRDSDVLQATVGGDPLEVLETIAHDGIDRRKDQSMGGKVWWRELEAKGIFRLQQNVISQHFRILDEEHYRWYSSFDEDEARHRLEELSGK